MSRNQAFWLVLSQMNVVPEISRISSVSIFARFLGGLLGNVRIPRFPGDFSVIPPPCGANPPSMDFSTYNGFFRHLGLFRAIRTFRILRPGAGPRTSIHACRPPPIPLTDRSLRRKDDVQTRTNSGIRGDVRLALIKALTRQNGVRSLLRAFDLRSGVVGCEVNDLGPAARTTVRQALSRMDLGASARSSSKIKSRLS